MVGWLAKTFMSKSKIILIVLGTCSERGEKVIEMERVVAELSREKKKVLSNNHTLLPFLSLVIPICGPSIPIYFFYYHLTRKLYKFSLLERTRV